MNTLTKKTTTKNAIVKKVTKQKKGTYTAIVEAAKEARRNNLDLNFLLK